jgi:hypothetical protein
VGIAATEDSYANCFPMPPPIASAGASHVVRVYHRLIRYGGGKTSYQGVFVTPILICEPYPQLFRIFKKF